MNKMTWDKVSPLSISNINDATSVLSNMDVFYDASSCEC